MRNFTDTETDRFHNRVLQTISHIQYAAIDEICSAFSAILADMMRECAEENRTLVGWDDVVSNTLHNPWKSFQRHEGLESSNLTAEQISAEMRRQMDGLDWDEKITYMGEVMAVYGLVAPAQLFLEAELYRKYPCGQRLGAQPDEKDLVASWDYFLYFELTGRWD